MLTGLSVFWFERDRAHRRQPPPLRDRRRARRGARPRAGRAQAADAPGRVRRARLHHRLRLEGLPATGSVSGIALPAGLQESQQLPEPLFTPSTKADVGHDEAIDFEGAVELVGDRALAEQRPRRRRSSSTRSPREHARDRGVILADTKFEFGLDDDGALAVGDEVLTPTPRATGRPTATSRAAGSRASTSSTCATGRPAPVGQDAARAGDPRRRRRAARARATWRRTSASPASRSRAWLRADARRVRARVLIRPKAGHPRPAGHRGRARAARARLRGCRATCTSGASSSSTWRIRRSCSEMCRAAAREPVIEDYEVVAQTPSRPLATSQGDVAGGDDGRRGEVRRRPLPGTCDERLRAAAGEGWRRRCGSSAMAPYLLGGDAIVSRPPPADHLAAIARP